MPTKERRLKEQAKQSGSTATLEAPTEALTLDLEVTPEPEPLPEAPIAEQPSDQGAITAPTYPRCEALGIGAP